MIPIPDPKLPSEQELRQWGVEQWIDHFVRYDFHRAPILYAMHDRSLTPANLEAAVAEAEREERRQRQMLITTIRRLLAEHGASGSQEGSAWGSSLPDGVASTAIPTIPPWAASLPEACFQGELRSAWDGLREECPAVKAAMQLFRGLSFQQRRPSPALRFVNVLMTSSVIGLAGAAFWKSEGFPAALTARYLLAASRFEAAADVMDAFSQLRLQGWSGETRRISRLFRTQGLARKR